MISVIVCHESRILAWSPGRRLSALLITAASPLHAGEHRSGFVDSIQDSLESAPCGRLFIRGLSVVLHGGRLDLVDLCSNAGELQIDFR
jgi:hypothetical protein